MNRDLREWRGVIAVLANPDSRRVLGLLAAELDASEQLAELTPARRARVLRAMRSAGLLEQEHASGATTETPRLRVERFAELLAADPVERPAGIERFVVNGRLNRYPARADDRAAVLHYVIDHVMPDSAERVDERTITDRIAAHTEDPVTMRRYLVDAGLLVRNAEGTSYGRDWTRNDDGESAIESRS